MRSPLTTTAAAVLLALCQAVAPGHAQEEAPDVPRPGLRPVPQVAGEIEGMIDADRRQLEEARAAFDEVVAKSDVSDEDLAHAYGRLGQIYYAYVLNDLAEVCFANATTLVPDAFLPHYYLGAIYATKGELEKAEEHLVRAREIQTDGPTLIRLGRVRRDLQKPEEAEEAFRAALELDPNSAAAYEGLGKIRYEQGETEEAIELLERALELQPEASSLHHVLGLAYRKLGDLEKAKEHLALNKSVEVLFPDPWVTDLNTLLKGSRLHLKAGNRAMDDGEFEEALVWFRRAVEADPEDKLAQNNLGYVLAEMKQPEEAMEAFRRALEIDPDYVVAHLNLAAALRTQGRYAEAVEHYERIHEIDPEDHLAHLQLGTTLMEAGELERAEKELLEVLDEVPEYENAIRSQANFLLGDAAEATGRDEEAVARYQKATALDEDSTLGHRSLARVLGKLGRYAEAAEHFGQVIAQEPQDVGARFGRAMSLILAERFTQAREALERDLQEVGDPVPLSHALARLLATCPDPQVRDGRRALELALDVFQTNATLDHGQTVAMAYAEVGEFPNAIAWQRKVVHRAEVTGQESLAETARERLSTYEAGRPVRSPWRDG